MNVSQAFTAASVAAALGLAPNRPVFANTHPLTLPPSARAAFEAANSHAGFPQARAGEDEDFDGESLATMSRADLDANIARFAALVDIIGRDARDDGRELTAREERRLDAAEERLALLRAEANGRRPAARKTAPEIQPDGTSPRAAGRIPAQARQDDPGKGGFENIGQFFAAVRKAGIDGRQTDPRLIALNSNPTWTGSEGVGADGGFAVPPDFRTQIMIKVVGEQSLLSLTDQQTSSSNSISFPADETTPWQNSGGVQAYWESEGGLKTQSKPSLVEKTVKLNKIIALVPLTDELLEDAPAMSNYVARKAPEKINFRINDAIINGSGVGMPMGILTSPGTVVVAKESGQATGSVMFNNITKLWTAVHPSARTNARWLMHPDTEVQLMSLAFPGAGTAVPAYLPPNGLSAAPFGTLMGKPIYFTEAMQPLGSQGDIAFGDLTNYISVVKAGGIRSDVSIHIWFDYDITAFRFVLRVGGMPWWNSPIAPYQPGATSRGFFSTLAARP